MNRVVANPEELDRVARLLDRAGHELDRTASALTSICAALPPLAAEVARSAQGPIACGLRADAAALHSLAAEVRQVGRGVRQASAGGLRVRLPGGLDRWPRWPGGPGLPPPLLPPLVGESWAPSGLRPASGFGGAWPGLPFTLWARAAGEAVVAGGGGRTSSGAAVAAALALLTLTALLSGSSGISQALQEEFRRQRKRREVAGLLAQPKPPFNDDEREKVRRGADELGIDRERFELLGRDPAHGWRTTDNAIEEARIGIRLERSGRLRDVVRSPDRETDLIEDGGAGARWDVKSFRSQSFDLEQAVNEIELELKVGDNVIVNTAYLRPQQLAQIRQAVTERGWADRVIYGSP